MSRAGEEVAVPGLSVDQMAILRRILAPEEIDLVRCVREVLADTGYGRVEVHVANRKVTGVNRLTSHRYEQR